MGDCSTLYVLIIAVAALSTTVSGLTLSTEGIHVLVTNDDGFRSPGLDALVRELLLSPAVTNVTVSAPLQDKTGRGNTTVPVLGPVSINKTISGYPAYAVPGYPSDSVLWALDVAGIEPDLVISGINRGMNLGNATCMSGTIGAARTAALRGIPSLVFSQEVPENATALNLTMHYDVAQDMANLTVSFLEDYKALAQLISLTPVGAQDIQSLPHVVSVNIPYKCTLKGANCDILQVKNANQPGLLSSLNDDDGSEVVAVLPPGVTNDIEAVKDGYIAVTELTADLSDIGCLRYSKFTT